MTAGVMDSNLFLASIGGTVTGCATSASLSMSGETRDTTCKTGTPSNKYRTFQPSFITATISFEGLHAEDESNEGIYDMHTKMNAQTRFEWRIGSTQSGDTYFTGNGYITSIEINGGAPGENVTYSGTITVDGAVTTGTNS